jgi:hypothetical protein
VVRGLLNGPRGGVEFNGASSFGNNLLMEGVDMSFGENSASASDKAAGTEIGRAAGQPCLLGIKLCGSTEPDPPLHAATLPTPMRSRISSMRLA